MSSEFSSLPQETAFEVALASVTPSGILTGCRIIRDGDDANLLPEEARTIRAIKPAARCASGAGRMVARRLLASQGTENGVILRAASGEPVWPGPFLGSIAHDDEVAVVAVTRDRSYRALGIDVEPVEPLPEEIFPLVVTERDNAGSIEPDLAGRLIFSAKEAVYKAAFPSDREILDYEDITINLPERYGVTKSGRRLTLSYCLSPRIAVLAYELA